MVSCNQGNHSLVKTSGIARTQPMPGHSVGTLYVCPALSCLQYGCRRNWGDLGDAPPENFGIFELHWSILMLL